MRNHGLNLMFDWALSSMSTLCDGAAELGYTDEARELRKLRDQIVDLKIDLNERGA